MTFDTAEKVLKKYGQEHIFAHYDELSDDEKKKLLTQIELIDFFVLENINVENRHSSKRGKFSPLGAVTIDDIEKNKEKYHSIGADAIKNGRVAAVLLAGGQGTRLGFEKPKGMFNIGVTKELYIFECLINNLLKVVEDTGAYVPLYIMTSEKNHDDTVNFFNEKNFFGYDKNYIKFFIQDMAASVDFNGKIYMERKSDISISPNGNGGWFSSIVRAGFLEDIKKNGIEWINVFAVDNVLQQIADPCFIGAVIDSGSQSGSKVVSKASPDERVGVLCLEDEKPSIVEYYEMTDEMRELRTEDGELAYKYGVILNYLFSVDRLEEIVAEKMPVHVVKKKIPYMNENGDLINPEDLNGYKFETLVLDMVHLQKSCLPYEVERCKEFAPVKNSEGVDSVDTARELLKLNGIEL
ncbi:MAG: UDPGP type 1 family protein [Ruminococcus sp.]|nr:UDPGP type 1 family protein [Ruminococcus sp.]